MKNYTLISLFSVFLYFGCGPAEKHDLTLNFDVGKAYTMKQETSQHFKQKIMGMDYEMTHRFNVIYSLYVKEYDNRQYILDFEYNDLTMNVEGSGISMSVGSGKDFDKEDTLNVILRSFTKKPFTVGITNNGEITFVEGLEEFFELVVADIGFVVAENEHEALRAFDQFIGEGGFKDNLNQLTNYLPGKPVSVNQKWKTEHIQTNLGFSGKWINEWQLVQIDDNTANVAGTSKFTIIQTDETDESTDLMSLSQFGIDVEMDGEQEINHFIDKTTGLINNGKVKAKMDGYFKMGESGRGMNIPISFEITSKISRVE